MPQTVQSSQYSSKSKPKSNPSGITMDLIDHTIATTSLNEIGDRVQLLRIPNKCLLAFLILQCADLDTGTALAANIVARTAAGDTILFTGATQFQAALAATVIWCNVEIDDPTLNEAGIDFVVTTAAGTPASGSIKLLACWM